jgi:nucleotide-binding universal stress UspA family protein
MTDQHEPDETGDDGTIPRSAGLDPQRFGARAASEIQTLLVPVDFSERSKVALELAAALAGTLGAELHVVHVLDVPRFVPRETSPHAASLERRVLVALMESNARVELEAFVNEAKRNGAPVTRAFIAVGPTSQTIVEAAEHDGYDLVVMGACGRTGLSRAMFGSVAEKVVRAAPCPTLTVGHIPRCAKKIERILVAVDYSNASRSALEYATGFARKFGAELDVVHVWDRPGFVAEELTVRYHDGSSRGFGELIREGAERELSDFLAAFHDGKTNPTLAVASYRVLSGEPAATLLAELGQGSHDLVVLGTHGRTGLKRLLLGSVAEKLVRSAAVPVLVVPPRARHEAQTGKARP